VVEVQDTQGVLEECISCFGNRSKEKKKRKKNRSELMSGVGRGGGGGKLLKGAKTKNTG